MLNSTFAALFSGFALLVLICSCQSTGSNRECYNTTGDPVCFFRDRPEFRWLTWQQAKDTCKSLSATLPRIPNAAIQDLLELYLASVHQNDLSDIWMGGKNRGNGWKWVHDKPIDPVSQTHYEDIHYTNWQPNVASQSDYECMTIALGESYKWKKARCDAYFRFVCQTGPSVIALKTTSIKPTPATSTTTSTTTTAAVTTTTTSTNTTTTTKLATLDKPESLPLTIILAVAAGAMFLIMICVIITVIIIFRRKKRRGWSENRAASRDVSYQYLKKRPGQDNTRNREPYTEIRLPLRQGASLGKDQTLKSTQSDFDYAYEEIEDGLVPRYLEVIQ